MSPKEMGIVEAIREDVKWFSDRGYHVTLEVDPFDRWEVGLLIPGGVGDHVHVSNLADGFEALRRIVKESAHDPV